MPNFFVDGESFLHDTVKITGEEANHAIKVLRIKKGDRLTLFDGAGNCAEAVAESIGGRELFARVLCRFASLTEPGLKITLFQGIPKNPKMDLIIQKAVEIGVCRIVPVRTHRSVAKIDGDKKAERYNRIAFEAAKQCGRALVPEVSAPVSFEEALEEARGCGRILIPYECERLAKIGKLDNCGSLAIFIGPEGGFEEAEVKRAEECGARRVTLGKRILRTETAGLVCAAICLHIAGEMG